MYINAANSAIATHSQNIGSVMFLGTPRNTSIMAIKRITDVNLPNHLLDKSIFSSLNKDLI